MTERDNWLQSLKMGDAVIVRRWAYGKVTYEEATVEKVTPAGMVKVGGRLYKGGVARGDRRYEIFSPDDQKIQEERMQQRRTADEKKRKKGQGKGM